MKTFSFMDFTNQDFVKWDLGHINSGKTVKINAEDHEHAQYKFIEQSLCEDTDWTNTGVRSWCWEDME